MYDSIALSSFAVQIQNAAFNRTRKFQDVGRQKKSKVVLCGRRVFLKEVFFVLVAYFPQHFSLYHFLLFLLCSRTASFFPSFPFTLHSSVFFPKCFLSEGCGMNGIFPVK